MECIQNIVLAQKQFFRKKKPMGIEFRVRQLQKLRKVIKEYEKEMIQALREDLNKPEFEAYGTEIGAVLDEIRFVIGHLKKWMKPEQMPVSLANFPSSGNIYSEPYGVILIMSPWNYPVLLTLEPLIGAIAAGNCVVVKPSDYSANVSNVIGKMIRKIFPPEYVAVISGGRGENESLLTQKFDYIFFTGSVEVGKKVMEAAAQHLIPVTLELGGKSPCIVDETANLDMAAKRIVWGKFLNAGQTCVAPDYVLVQESVKSQLINRLIKYISQFYGIQAHQSESFPKIINTKHFKRLQKLLKCGKIIIGGKTNTDTNQISPTLLDDIWWDSPVMEEEIFGPILPILTFQTLGEAVKKISSRPKPLAAYYFTSDLQREKYLLQKLSFGGGCINDTVMHLVGSTMPFGGVGASGMGAYHGKHSFDTFSHKKSILKKAVWMEISLRYPPYKKWSLSFMKKILK